FKQFATALLEENKSITFRVKLIDLLKQMKHTGPAIEAIQLEFKIENKSPPLEMNTPSPMSKSVIELVDTPTKLEELQLQEEKTHNALKQQLFEINSLLTNLKIEQDSVELNILLEKTLIKNQEADQSISTNGNQIQSFYEHAKNNEKILENKLAEKQNYLQSL